MNHSLSTTSNVLRSIQKTSSPMKPIKDSLNRYDNISTDVIDCDIGFLISTQCAGRYRDRSDVRCRCRSAGRF